MDKKELRSELAFFVNVTEGTADVDFATTRLNKFLDRGYNYLVEKAKLQSSRNLWVTFVDITWPASTLRFTLPTEIHGKVYIATLDVTGGEPGVRFDAGPDFTWAGTHVWQWPGTAGPGAAKTIRVFYEAVAESLISDESVPVLVPPQYHWLIVWQAALLMRTLADDRVPTGWREEYNEMFLDYLKHVSRGRPLTSTPRIHGGSGGLDSATTLNVAGFGSVGDGLSPP